jgi:hypothetical protein
VGRSPLESPACWVWISQPRPRAFCWMKRTVQAAQVGGTAPRLTAHSVHWSGLRIHVSKIESWQAVLLYNHIETIIDLEGVSCKQQYRTKFPDIGYNWTEQSSTKIPPNRARHD